MITLKNVVHIDGSSGAVTFGLIGGGSTDRSDLASADLQRINEMLARLNNKHKPTAVREVVKPKAPMIVRIQSGNSRYFLGA